MALKHFQSQNKEAPIVSHYSDDSFVRFQTYLILWSKSFFVFFLLFFSAVIPLTYPFSLFSLLAISSIFAKGWGFFELIVHSEHVLIIGSSWEAAVGRVVVVVVVVVVIVVVVVVVVIIVVFSFFSIIGSIC